MYITQEQIYAATNNGLEKLKKLIDGFRSDLEKYSESSKANDFYIEKQNQTLKSLVVIFNEVEKDIRFLQEENMELHHNLKLTHNMLKAHNMVLEMAHVINPHPLRFPLVAIEECYKCHIEHCTDSLHKHN